MAAFTTIDDPEAFFQPVIYTGTGSSQAVTLPGSTDMQPDIVWINGRDQANMDQLYDSQRGVLKFLSPNISSGEEALSGTGTAAGMSAFGSDGFTVLTHNGINKSSQLYVALCWKAGTTGTDLTAGGIDPSSSSINTTSGFGIYKWTGTGSAGTVAHGLGAVPHCIIIKQDASRDWAVYHKYNTAAPETDYLILNTNAATADALLWNDTAHTSTLISLGDGAEVNQDSSDTYICYAWTEKQGFSKFGQYTGNGNADGPFVWTGFKPSFVMIKKSSATDSWTWYNNADSPINPINEFNYADVDDDVAETSGGTIDFLSNGFKIRTTLSDVNTSGATFVTMCFAEAPFVNSEGVPCNAR